MQTLLAWGACVIPTRWSAKQKSKGTQKIRNEKHQLLFLLLPPLQNESRTVHCNRSSLLSFLTFIFLLARKASFSLRNGTARDHSRATTSTVLKCVCTLFIYSPGISCFELLSYFFFLVVVVVVLFSIYFFIIIILSSWALEGTTHSEVFLALKKIFVVTVFYWIRDEIECAAWRTNVEKDRLGIRRETTKGLLTWLDDI